MSMVDDYCSSSRYRYRERERERAKGQPRHTSIDPAGEDRRESSSRRENRTGRRVVRKRVAATASGRMGRSILRFFARRQRPCDILHNYTRGHVTKTPHTQRADIDLLLNWRADTQKSKLTSRHCRRGAGQSGIGWPKSRNGSSCWSKMSSTGRQWHLKIAGVVTRRPELKEQIVRLGKLGC